MSPASRTRGSGDATGAAPTRTGGCLCGAVRYRVTGALRDVLLCHCEQCRRTSGYQVAATRAQRADVSLEADAGLRWYESSPGVYRGFCGECGSSLFWQPGDPHSLGIMAGSLDSPTGLTIAGQIHTADAADYHVIDPAVPVLDEGGRSPATATVGDHPARDSEETP